MIDTLTVTSSQSVGSAGVVYVEELVCCFNSEGRLHRGKGVWQGNIGEQSCHWQPACGVWHAVWIRLSLYNVAPLVVGACGGEHFAPGLVVSDTVTG